MDKLSRAERRALERKQRNKERKIQARALGKTKSPQEKIVAPSSKVFTRLKKIFHPRVLGSETFLNGEHLAALSYRLPIFFLLCLLTTHEDCSPYIVQASLGPSMLPSIQFIGDLWLVETGAWSRLLGRDPSIETGDVVIWKDPKNGRVSCKRVIGIGGSKVQRYGQFSQVYHERDDWGIIWPKDAEERGLDVKCEWDSGRSNGKNLHRTIEVPDDHVWLEGDCPPFSLDSRHYGPIPSSWIRGRLLLRIWPFQREDEFGGTVPNWVQSERPTPYSSVDQYLGKHNNFYRVRRE